MNSQELVKLRKRPLKNGRSFTYYIDYVDLNGKRQRKSLGHRDIRKAQRQVAKLEKELKMGYVKPKSISLKQLYSDHQDKTRGQVRQSTISLNLAALKEFTEHIGNIDICNVNFEHGERFLQFCLDRGNAPATACRKIRHLKRVFQLAVDRGQLESNPFRRLKLPKCPEKQIRVLDEQECHQLRKAAQDHFQDYGFNWLIVIDLALFTGMRRGEILNLTWKDIDFGRMIVGVNPKRKTDHTWYWEIKDKERRRLPLSEDLLNRLALHQIDCSEGNPYLFIPGNRYKWLIDKQRLGQWKDVHSTNPLGNYDRSFKRLLKRAGLEDISFHDLRRTCLSNWFKNGMREYDVMRMAGHSSFDTTRKFYLASNDKIIERTRLASMQSFVTFCHTAPNSQKASTISIT